MGLHDISDKKFMGRGTLSTVIEGPVTAEFGRNQVRVSVAEHIVMQVGYHEKRYCS